MTAAKLKNKSKVATTGLRMAAAQGVQGVVDHGFSLDEVMDKTKLTIDASLLPQVQEICYGSVRWYGYLDSKLKVFLSKPMKSKDRIVYFLLIVSVYQIAMMRTPDHAVVNEAVVEIGQSRWRWAKGLVNAVLRKFVRQLQTQPLEISETADKLTFPQWMAEQIESDWPHHWATILSASNAKPPFTLRVNQQKSTREAWLSGCGVDAVPCEQSKVGVVISQPMAVSKVFGFSDGVISVQDESAQLVPEALQLQPGMRVLDGCAAPGGKSCHILEHQPDIEELVVVDLPDRIVGVTENLKRLKLKATVLTGSFLDDEIFVGQGTFNRILLDVPCTGTGVIRRHPDIKFRRLKKDSATFSVLQLQLLECAWKKLQPGGILLYVTCSVLDQENEGVIAPFLEKTQDATVDILPDIYGLQTASGRQRLPGVHSGDGFFYSRLKKDL